MRILFIILLFFINFYSFSNPVDTIEAKQVAINYYNYINPLSTKKSIKIKKTFVHKYQSINTYYTFVFNNNDFIVISADNATVPVFAFSTEHNFSSKNISPEYKYWMQTEYDKWVYYVQTNNISNTKYKQEWDNIKNNNIIETKSNNEVSPLLTTKWGQQEPNDDNSIVGINITNAYNFYAPNTNYCGCGKCFTGCVPVAMAQIMNYWRYPYNDFDWCNMTDSLMLYNVSRDERPTYIRERNAIAELMYDCGIKSDIHYCVRSTCESFVWPSRARNTFRDDYGYSDDIKRVFRMTTPLFKHKIRKDLKDGYPVLYTGLDNNFEGHAWVCDGYKDKDFFHFNMGWNGNENGYYYISPSDSPHTNFTIIQEAIIRIYPSDIDNYLKPGCFNCDGNKIISNNVNYNSQYFNIPCITWFGLPSSYNYSSPSHPPHKTNTIYENGVFKLVYDTIKSGTIHVIHSKIPLNNKVYLKAIHEIVLENFETEEGSDFIAEIIPCPNSLYYLTNPIISENNNLANNKFANNVNIYPNPGTGIYTLEINTEQQAIEYQIYNSFGNIIQTTPLYNNNSTIDISNQPTGIYFVKIIFTDGKTINKKIIKN